MFKRVLRNWSVKQQLADFRRFNESLALANSDEIGMTLALSTALRNMYEERELDLLHPYSNSMTIEDLAIFLAREETVFQKNGQAHFAAGIRIWRFTARAFIVPELRSAGREMWKNLSRGIGFAEAGIQDYNRMTGDFLTIRGFEEVPPGLEPEPI